MKITVKYNVPVATWIEGEIGIESEKDFEDLQFHDKIDILRQIAIEQDYIPCEKIESAYEAGYASLTQVVKE